MKPTPVAWENIIEVVGGPVVKESEVAKDIQIIKINFNYMKYWALFQKF